MRTFYLFTNRNIAVFDDRGEQDVPAQQSVSCYHIDREAAQRAVDSCDRFYISAFGEWSHLVGKRSIEYLLGLRTQEMDMADG